MALHKILRHLCLNSGWSYVVFWKLKRSQMVLTWEDGYYENHSSSINGFGTGGGSADEQTYSECQIELLLAKMSHYIYFTGEGVIGRVAFTGKHKWVFADEGNTNNSSSQCTLEKIPSGWDVQFAAGIKTIAVIPVPQGVVQLGSTKMMKESMGWVIFVKSSFGSLQNAPGAYLSDMVLEGQGDKKLTSTLCMSHGMVGKIDQTQPVRGDADINKIQSQSFVYEIHDSPESFKCAANILKPLTITVPSEREVLQTMENKVVASIAQISSATTSSNQSVFSPVLNMSPLVTFGRAALSERTANEHIGLLPEISCRQEGNRTISANRILDWNSFIHGSSIIHNSFHQANFEMPDSLTYIDFIAGNNESLVGDVSEISYSGSECLKLGSKGTTPHTENAGNSNFTPHNSSNYLQRKNTKWDCTFAIGDELSKVLRPAFRENVASEDSDTAGADKVHQYKVALQIDGNNVSYKWGTMFSEDRSQFLKSKSELLLDAVVGKASNDHNPILASVDESFSSRNFSGIDSELSVLNSKEETGLRNARSKSFQEYLPESYVHAMPSECETSVHTHSLKKIIEDHLSFNTSTGCSPLKAILRSWPDDMQSMNSDITHASYSKKQEELTKATRKRARPGESTRPRPKDRQQIQDRVRELREIVPGGSKCSIDALLEKTIKHMVFLQNVTNHADVLKRNGQLKDDTESGASWAFELGNKVAGYPILVKNLSQPRQLLIQMFCEEKGQFLEIADAIRSLGLAILKGVMESRSHKIWALFVVEANKDVDRVDIIMSLIHLLHVNNHGYPGSSSSISRKHR